MACFAKQKVLHFFSSWVLLFVLLTHPIFKAVANEPGGTLLTRIESILKSAKQDRKAKVSKHRKKIAVVVVDIAVIPTFFGAIWTFVTFPNATARMKATGQARELQERAVATLKKAKHLLELGERGFYLIQTGQTGQDLTKQFFESDQKLLFRFLRKGERFEDLIYRIHEVNSNPPDCFRAYSQETCQNSLKWVKDFILQSGSPESRPLLSEQAPDQELEGIEHLETPSYSPRPIASAPEMVKEESLLDYESPPQKNAETDGFADLH